MVVLVVSSRFVRHLTLFINMGQRRSLCFSVRSHINNHYYWLICLRGGCSDRRAKKWFIMMHGTRILRFDSFSPFILYSAYKNGFFSFFSSCFVHFFFPTLFVSYFLSITTDGWLHDVPQRLIHLPWQCIGTSYQPTASADKRQAPKQRTHTEDEQIEYAMKEHNIV